jgi:hypothetical protein
MLKYYCWWKLGEKQDVTAASLQTHAIFQENFKNLI